MLRGSGSGTTDNRLGSHVSRVRGKESEGDKTDSRLSQHINEYPSGNVCSTMTKMLQCWSDQQYTLQIFRILRSTTQESKSMPYKIAGPPAARTLASYHVQSKRRTCRRHRSGQVRANNQTLAGDGYEAHGCSLQHVPIRISLHSVIHS